MDCRIETGNKAKKQYKELKAAKDKGATEVPDLGVYDIDLAL